MLSMAIMRTVERKYRQFGQICVTGSTEVKKYVMNFTDTGPIVWIYYLRQIKYFYIPVTKSSIVSTGMSKDTPKKTMDVIIYPCPNLKE